MPITATEKIWMNGEFVDWADAKIHIATHGLHYGTGVFEGIRCYKLVDGRSARSCLMFAVQANGCEVTTVEGLSANGQLHPLQRAFVEHDAPQCGFCTSGQLMSAKALLDRNPHPTAHDVRTALVGNICRCSNYNRYVEAIVAVGAGRTAPSADARTTGGAA